MLAAPDAEVVRRDPALPGLATLLDPEALADALQMPPLYLRYLRYKPGTNCVAGYSFALDAPAVELYAKAFAAGEELKQPRRSEMAQPLGAPRVLPRERVVLRPFPHDGRLRALRRLAAPEVRRKLLGRVFPDAPADALELRALRYKPERRYVAQLRGSDGPLGVLKAHTPAGFLRAAAGASTFHAEGALRLAPLLGRSQRHGLLLYGWLEGRGLGELLAEPGPPVAAVAATGAALAVLHRQEVVGLPCLSRAAEVDAVTTIAADVARVCPAVAEQIQSLAAGAARALALAPAPDRPVHGDFYAKQVLLVEGAAALLDLDRAARGDPAADLGLFLAHLERDALRGVLPRACLPALRSALLAGYAEHARLPAGSWIDFYLGLSLLLLAPDPFRHRDADWPARTAELVQAAAGYLGASRSRLCDFVRRRLA